MLLCAASGDGRRLVIVLVPVLPSRKGQRQRFLHRRRPARTRWGMRSGRRCGAFLAGTIGRLPGGNRSARAGEGRADPWRAAGQHTTWRGDAGSTPTRLLCEQGFHETRRHLLRRRLSLREGHRDIVQVLQMRAAENGEFSVVRLCSAGIVHEPHGVKMPQSAERVELDEGIDAILSKVQFLQVSASGKGLQLTDTVGDEGDDLHPAQLHNDRNILQLFPPQI